ncbi:hypothetical protein A2U01_0099635, partial [Trifolium medium]|nr:hypothetical protein [Trifolium medium]
MLPTPGPSYLAYLSDLKSHKWGNETVTSSQWVSTT